MEWQAHHTNRTTGGIATKELIVLLGDLAGVVATRRADAFERVIKAAFSAGASRQDLLIAVEIGRFLGGPPETVVAEASTTVHAWQWMASRQTVHIDDWAPCTDRRRFERRKTWIPCTTR